MAKHLLFLVPGMGDFSEQWSVEVAPLIKGLYGSYQTLSQALPFDSTFEIVEVAYNQHFEALREQWKSNSAQVLAALQAGKLPKSAITEMAKHGTVGTSDAFLATHLLDVFLYRFAPSVAELVRLEVGNTILKAVLAGSGRYVPAMVGDRALSRMCRHT